MIEGLRDRFHSLHQTLQTDSSYSSIIFSVEDFNFTELLDQSDNSIFYFQDPNEELLGIGSCKNLEGKSENRITEIQQQFELIVDNLHIIDPENSGLVPRILGGFTFDHTQINNMWNNFSPATFILPSLLFYRDGDSVFVIVTFYDIEVIDRLLEQLSKSPINGEKHHDDRVQISSINYPVDEKAWREMVITAQNKMNLGKLEKVVLSRICEIETTTSIDVKGLINRLQSNYPNCYIFYFQLDNTRFFGASPELLCSVDKSEVSTIALAGTRPRGKTEPEDLQFSDELMSNQKERKEHQVVVENILHQMTKIGKTPSYDPTPSILKLSNVQHLITSISTTIDPGITIFNVISNLHPTPALGGEPRDVALELITSIESHPRGMYAGPVGWIDTNNNGKLIVAIRSAINRDYTTWLYAGAGIMKESNYEKEWDEIELKFRPILQALGVEL